MSYIETLRELRLSYNSPINPDLEIWRVHATLDWALSLLASEHASKHAHILKEIAHYESLAPHRNYERETALSAGAAALIEREQLRKRIAELEAVLLESERREHDAIERVSKLAKTSISCCFCGCDNESLGALKKHSAGCPEHPAVKRITELKAALAAK